MSDINPNVPVTDSPVSTSLASGDSQPSFDDLESLMLNQEHAVKGGSKKAAKDDAPKKAADKPKDLRTDDAKAKDVEAKKTEGKKAGEKEGDGKTLEKPKPRKTYKGKYQDQSLDVDEEAEFTVKVNGQEIPVKAKDLFENYSGKTAWEKKFSEVSQDRMAVKSEQRRVQEFASKIKNMFSEQDPQVRLFKMAELAGMSPIEFRKQSFENLIKDVESYSQMSEDERKAADLKFENEYLKHKATSTQESLRAQQAEQELRNHVKGLLQKTGIPEQSFNDRLEEMSKLTREQIALLEKDGKFIGGRPTAEFVVETIKKDELWNAVEDALEGVKLNWDQKTKAREVTSLVNDAYMNGLRAKDMADVVSEIFGKAKAKRVLDQVEREREEHYTGKRPESPQVTRNSADVDFFDDL